jgi:hypothetical protein
MRRTTQSYGISRTIAASIAVIVVILSSFIVVFYVLPLIEHRSATGTVRLNIRVSYSGTWNGSYTYGNNCPGSQKVLWNGTGSKNVNITFQGNFNAGFGYSVQIQKDDNTSSLLILTVIANMPDMLSNSFSQTHSNSTAFGKLEWSSCVIS